MKSNIALIGPMASGKTTVGKLLAEKLGWEFIDSDHYIEAKESLSVAEIFEQKGEAYFRQQEEKAIAELVTRENSVLATGGGAVISKLNREALKNNSFVVYLKVSVKAQLMRTQGDLSRPLINVANRQRKLEQLQKEREQLYIAITNLLIDSPVLPIQKIISLIEAEYLSQS